MGDGLDSHIAELRARILFVTALFIVFSGIGFYFSPQILNWLQADLSMQLNAFVAYEVFYTQLMIAGLTGFVTTLPFMVWQSLKFAEPGLKQKEYKILRNFLPFSLFLFLLGAVFSYEFVVKTSLSFFEANTAGTQVAPVWGLKKTLGYALKLSIFSGLMFQLPIVAALLGWLGMISSELMRKYRIYFILLVLLISAMATPPDVLTQLLVTLPVIGLYQLSIWIVLIVEN